MNQKANLSKIQACNQIWESMPACENGRLCTVCNHIITDFRGKSEWKIALTHAQSEQKVCGIYDKKTLRPKSDSKAPAPHTKRFVLAGIMGFITTITTVFSQVNHEQVMVEAPISEHHPERSGGDYTPRERIRDSKSKQKHDTLVLRGTLFGESGGPLVGATILIQGTEKGVITDTNGQFDIDVTEELAELDSISIIVSYIGYGRFDKAVHKADFNPQNECHISVILKEQSQLEVFYIESFPFHKRVWHRIKRIFRKKN